MRPGTGPFPNWLKTLIILAGLALFLPGVLIALVSFCTIILSASDRGGGSTFSLVVCLLTLFTFGAGFMIFRNALDSLRGRPSTRLRLPQAWILAALFALCLFLGILVRQSQAAAGLFFPPILIIAAALPALLAVSWFRTSAEADELTWRRGLMAFIGGATVSIFLAGVLELLAPTFFLNVILNRGEAVARYLQLLLTNLAGNRIAEALTSRGFVIVFIQLAIVAPLIEETVKPLVTLPLIGRLTRRDAFLVAALAGVGFATVENIIYASADWFAWYAWAGVLLVRAVGGAIHPLGAGLVGLSWRDWLNGEREAFKYGWIRFGMAVGMHALWNGGSLLVITLAGTQFFGSQPELNLLGLSFAGINLALLVVLGLTALWVGRAVASSLQLPWEREAESTRDMQFLLSNRAAALWALACLVMILPASITALRLLLR